MLDDRESSKDFFNAILFQTIAPDAEDHLVGSGRRKPVHEKDGFEAQSVHEHAALGRPDVRHTGDEQLAAFT